jgi:membrane-bound lytic murein transglycosylase D
MAAAVIGTDPARFGFDLPDERTVRETYDVVSIPAVTSLAQVARDAGTTVAELRTANSDLASTATTTPARNFPLYIPKGGGERLARSLAAAPGASSAGDAASWPERASSAATSTPSGTATSRAVPAVATTGDRPRVYTVRRGDTLSRIARQYGVSVGDLASWNGLRPPYRLSIGQKLDVHGTSGPPRVVYTVKRGNTLSAIADVFSVRYRDIMSWNKLRRNTLQVGQELVIHPPRPLRVESYRVRRGDTVAKIARRYGVPVRDVLTANGLGKRTVIRPGQRLVVYVGS